MELTTEMLTPYVGGRAEIQNPDPDTGYLLEAEIETIEVNDDGDVVMKFTRVAEGEGFPAPPKRWVWKNDPLDYTVDMRIATASNVGPGSPTRGGGDRILLHSPLLDEAIALFPADANPFNWSKVVDEDAPAAAE